MSAERFYLLLADGLLIIHVLFVAFVLVGLLLIVVGAVMGWPWVRHPWFRLAHLGAIGYVVIQAWMGQLCPLTLWEGQLRRAAGHDFYEGSFIAYWLGRLLYYEAPEWVFVLAYTLFALAVLIAFILAPPRWKAAVKHEP